MKTIIPVVIFLVVIDLYACSRLAPWPSSGPRSWLNPLRAAVEQKMYRARIARIEIDESVGDMAWDSDAIANMTDAQLRGLVYTQPRIVIPDLYGPEHFSVPWLEDNEEKESEEGWHWFHSSFSSEESARDAAQNFAALQRATTSACTFTGENAYYYQYRLVLVFSDYPHEHFTRIERLVFFKDSAVTLEAVPALQKTTIHDTEAKNVSNMLDLFLFFRDHNNSGVQRIHREFHEAENEYRYIAYSTQTAFGSGGISDRISLVRTVWTVDKNHGSVEETEREEIKRTYGIERHTGLVRGW